MKSGSVYRKSLVCHSYENYRGAAVFFPFWNSSRATNFEFRISRLVLLGGPMLEIQERGGAAILSVRVQPRASKDELAGEMNGALKVRLRAPAVENRANDALIDFLAQLLKTPKSAVRILSGDRSRTKRIEIRGVTGQQIHALLPKEA